MVPLYKGRNSDTERLSNLPKATKVTGDKEVYRPTFILKTLDSVLVVIGGVRCVEGEP